METLTIETLLDAMAKIPKEPIGEWMREQGHPPEEWNLILPESLRQGTKPSDFLPKYLSFSEHLDQPAFVRKEVLFPTVWWGSPWRDQYDWAVSNAS